MSTSVRPEPDPKARIRRNVEKMASMGASEAEIEAYLQQEGLTPQADATAAPTRAPLALDVRQKPESTMALPYDKNRPGDLEALASIPAGLKVIAPEAARGASSLALSASQAVPGMESFQAMMGAAGSRLTDSPMSFDESRDALRAETSKIPAEVRIASQLVAGGGAAKAMTKLPKVGAALRSPTKAGATVGAADQALSADDMTLEERLARTAIGGAAGAGAGLVLDDAVTMARAAKAPRFDTNIAKRTADMGSADNVAYGAAAKEMSAAGGTHPAIKAALLDPRVEGYTKAVRSMQAYANADDATVLREAYKLMGERQRALGSRLLNSDDFKAGSSLEKAEIDDAKKVVLAAADNLGPAFRKAVQQHAVAEGEIRALKHGKSAADQLISRRDAGSQAALRRGPEALRRRLPNMTLEERLAAEEGALARLRSTIGVQPNLPSLGGTLTTAIRPARVSPLLREIGTPKQVLLDDLIRAGLLTSTAGTP